MDLITSYEYMTDESIDALNTTPLLKDAMKAFNTATNVAPNIDVFSSATVNDTVSDNTQKLGGGVQDPPDNRRRDTKSI